MMHLYKSKERFDYVLNSIDPKNKHARWLLQLIRNRLLRLEQYVFKDEIVEMIEKDLTRKLTDEEIKAVGFTLKALLDDGERDDG